MHFLNRKDKLCGFKTLTKIVNSYYNSLYLKNAKIMKIKENLENSSTDIKLHSLKGFIETLTQSRKLILVVTVLLTIVFSFYLIKSQPNDKYISNAVIEIGKYTNSENEVKYLDDALNLNLALETKFMLKLVNDKTKIQVASSIKKLGPDLLRLETTSTSKQQTINSLNEMISYIVDRQEKMIKDIKTQSLAKLNIEYDFQKNELDMIKIERKKILTIDLPLISIKQQTKTKTLQRKINEINEVSLPLIDDERKAITATLQRKINEINNISLPSIENDMESKISGINRSINFVDLSLTSTGESVTDMTQRIGTFYIESLNKEQKVFESASLTDSLEYTKISS